MQYLFPTFSTLFNCSNNNNKENTNMTRIQIADLVIENVTELTAEEELLIQGGFWWVVASAVGAYVINNWPDIKKGVSDAWNGV